jgi:hypothetical protein
MTWVRIDDQFADHPKFLGLGSERLAATGLWLIGLAYANRHLTNGFIPRLALPADASPRLIRRLVEVGLWRETPNGGWDIHDYLEFQPSREEVLKLREDRREAGRKGGQRSGVSRRASAEASAQAGDVAVGDTDAEGEGVEPQSRPVPTPAPPKSESEDSSPDYLQSAGSGIDEADDRDAELQRVVNAFAERCGSKPTEVQIDNGIADWVQVDGAAFLLGRIAIAPQPITSHDLYAHLRASVSDRRKGREA